MVARSTLTLVLALIAASCTNRPPAEPAPAETTAEETAGAEAPAETVEAPAATREDEVAPLRLTVLNSGQGDCALLQCPNGANVMIDCGSTAAAGTSPEAVAARLDELIGEDGIDVLVLTHPDQDHYNWLERVLGDRPIARAIHSRSLSEYTVRQFNTWLPDHAQEIVQLDGEVHDTERSELFDCGEDVDIRILAANAHATSHPNDRGWISNGASIVLRVHREVNGESFTAILTGDATFDTENAMLTAYANTPDVLDCDVLRLGHHGTDVTSTSDAWLAATTPRIAFSSSGHHGSFRHPRCSVSDRVGAVENLDTVDCHALVCGAGAGETCVGGFCTRSFARAVYDTFSAGEITIEFDGELQVRAAQIRPGSCAD